MVGTAVTIIWVLYYFTVDKTGFFPQFGMASRANREFESKLSGTLSTTHAASL